MKKIALFVAAALLAGATISCHHNEADGHEHHHEHGEQMTAYNNDFELFAEVNPLIVGEECDILAHLTRLSNFKPLDSTKVTMVVKLGESRMEQVVEKPGKAGIYEFCLTPKSAGCGSIFFEISTGDTVSRIGFGHVHFYADKAAAEEHSHGHEGHSHEGHGHSHDGHGHEGHSHSHEGHSHSHEGHSHSHEGHSHSHEGEHAAANAITFTKEQSWKVDFATEVLKPVKFGRIIRTSAQVLPSAGDEREISAKTSGIVVFANKNLVDGTQVGAGQRLFTIESSGMADNNMGVRFQEAESAYKLAKSEYERKQKLAEDKIVSQSELQRAKMELEGAQAIYNNLKTNFSAKGQAVNAPMGGYVKNITVKNGAYVEAGQVLATVSQNRELSIRAEVQPRYYEDLAHVQSANIRLMNSDEVYSITGMGGAHHVYGRSTDPRDPLIPVTFTFPNKLNLVSGSFVTLYITTEGENEVVTIPNTGIVEDMGAYFVFVQITPEQFEKREVTLGATDGERTVLATGVKAGERVVSKGAIMVKLAAGAGALDPHAGHVH